MKHPFLRQIRQKIGSKKPLFILLGVFLAVGIAAQTLIVAGGNTRPIWCKGNAFGLIHDVCRHLYTEGSKNNQGTRLDSFDIVAQNGNRFLLQNHTGELANGGSGQGLQMPPHTHWDGNQDHGHNHPLMLDNWVGVSTSNTHTHIVVSTNANPKTPVEHQGILLSGFAGVTPVGTVPIGTQHQPISGVTATTPVLAGTDYPGIGYHQMTTGPYSGKWIGVGMEIDGTPDYHIYETEPKRVFVPNKTNIELQRFLNSTKKAGDFLYDQNLELNTGTASADGELMYDPTATDPYGIQVTPYVLVPVSGACEKDANNNFTGMRHYTQKCTLHNVGFAPASKCAGMATAFNPLVVDATCDDFYWAEIKTCVSPVPNMKYQYKCKNSTGQQVSETNCTSNVGPKPLAMIGPDASCIPQFSCGNLFYDTRAGLTPSLLKTYGTTNIGGKCWFTDDLEYRGGT